MIAIKSASAVKGFGSQVWGRESFGVKGVGGGRTRRQGGIWASIRDRETSNTGRREDPGGWKRRKAVTSEREW